MSIKAFGVLCFVSGWAVIVFLLYLVHWMAGLLGLGVMLMLYGLITVKEAEDAEAARRNP